MPGGRLDRVTWVVHQENLDRHVALAAATFGIDFESRDGRQSGGHQARSGTRSCVSWDGGLEFVAPGAEEHPVSRRYQDFLEQHGEGLYGIVFGVDDLDAAATRARAAGYPVSDSAVMPDAENDSLLPAWTTKVTHYAQRPLGDVMGSHVTLGRVNYVASAKPRRRLDHFIWVVHEENCERHVASISETLGIQFDHYDGPSYKHDAFGIHTYMSWDAGLEIIAPVGDDDQVASHFQAFLAEYGEAPYGFVFGVDDLDEAADRARASGYAVSGLLQTPDTELRQALLRRWTTKVTDCKEMLVGEMVGIRVMIGQFAYAAGA